MATSSVFVTRRALRSLLRSSWQHKTTTSATTLANNQVHPLSTSRLLHTTAGVAAGHSHWHNIQHKKGRKDAARSAKFSKIGKAIVDCVRRGGVDGNPRLTSIIDNAKAQSFPRERIESAINRGLGKTDNPLIDVMHEVTVGGGVGILLECHTDSKARTHADIQRALKKTNGHHVPNKSILFNFERRAAIHLPPQHVSEIFLSLSLSLSILLTSSTHSCQYAILRSQRHQLPQRGHGCGQGSHRCTCRDVYRPQVHGTERGLIDVLSYW
eukprot:TRINITY_DN2560_c0_g2_i2.p1 TRINITY_DN2560_c0_g2~~TRINITY_DN2560_c0_g2_i2.p1  ORF type:complete len:269 (+),score=26.08 TRINITY_DN2560_c0_g2_i2:83-889(+)